MAREFFRESWKRGFDIKFGLASVVTQVFCMSIISAFGAVAMFWLLRRVSGSDQAGFWLALLYAFGTPVFFRTGFLNHNMILGHFAFIGFLLLWNPGEDARLGSGWRTWIAGLAGGMALLLDYSGVIMLAGLFCYAMARAWQKARFEGTLRMAASYALGATGPILLLWWYQWRSFGNPFLPGQHWMPPVEWIDIGYQGFTLPQPDLIRHLLFDYRYGLFTTCPLLLLSVIAIFWYRRSRANVPGREFWAMLLLSLGLLLFCAGISYTRLQYNNGLRYLAPLLPFLFVSTAWMLQRIPRRLAFLLAIAAVGQAWSMAMYRDVERGWGVLDPILHVLIGGFQLPVLTVLSRMGAQYGDYAAQGASPLPIFVIVAAVMAVIWGPGRNAGEKRGTTLRSREKAVLLEETVR
jgi:hypothetical protein